MLKVMALGHRTLARVIPHVVWEQCTPSRRIAPGVTCMMMKTLGYIMAVVNVKRVLVKRHERGVTDLGLKD